MKFKKIVIVMKIIVILYHKNKFKVKIHIKTLVLIYCNKKTIKKFQKKLNHPHKLKWLKANNLYKIMTKYNKLNNNNKKNLKYLKVIVKKVF